jgi:ATP-dependent Clp protease, protease subunit
VSGGRDLAEETARRLFERRTVMLTGPLEGESASLAGASLMALDAEGDEPVTLLVNSPGGPVEAGVAVVDVLDLLGVPVEATVIGQAVGTAAVVVACATPGRRRAAPNARLSLRLAEGALEGPAGRLEREVADLVAARDRLVDRLMAATGRTRDELAEATDRGHVLSADEAVAFGVVDEIARRRP